MNPLKAVPLELDFFPKLLYNRQDGETPLGGDTMKAPTTLKRLAELCDYFEDNEGPLEPLLEEEVCKWLCFTYELLTTRKTYHRKQQIRRKMLLKVAEEQLSPDELQEINRQAGDLANQAVAVEVENEGLGDEGPNNKPEEDSTGE